jgi:hypothetical protein
MKAVAAALLLIVGAAVVLWYGNTLNSWVLGGLIGGLAALLLSIPISLVLFSYLSRRHDEHVRAQAEEEAAFALAQNFQDAPRFRRANEVEGYIRPVEEEAYPRQIEAPRHLPVPTASRLPVAKQRTTNQLPARQPAKKAPTVYTREANGRRPTGRMNYPGFPGYEPGSSHSQHRAAAIRAARREAARQSQYDHDDVEVLPTRISRQLPPGYMDEEQIQQDWQPVTRRASRESPQSTDNSHRPHPHRTVDARPAQSDAARSLPPAVGSSAARASRYYEEPHTDYLPPQESQTEPLHQGTPSPQTDQIARPIRQNGRSRDPETITGSIQKPLVRRAPYLYDDDLLGQELARQLDAPAVRRSSRSLEHDEEDL